MYLDKIITKLKPNQILNKNARKTFVNYHIHDKTRKILTKTSGKDQIFERDLVKKLSE